MEEVNKIKRNRKKKPENERRVQLAARVRPDIRHFVESYRDANGHKNVGRAVDEIIAKLMVAD